MPNSRPGLIAAEDNGQILEIELNNIIPSSDQARKHFDDDAIADLAQSIKEDGLLSPVGLQRDGDKFKLVFGERRYRAFLMLGSATIKAVCPASAPVRQIWVIEQGRVSGSS